jgi:hypothetical protein
MPRSAIRSLGRSTHRVATAAFGVVALLLPATFAHATKVPLPAPDPERGTIAVTVRGRAPAGNKAPSVQVSFVRLDHEVEMFAADSVIQSNFSGKKQVYLLNAKPGRYVAVATQLRGTGLGDYRVFLDKASIAETEVEVTPGEIAFMGDFLLDLKTKMKGADEAQAHYYRLLAPSAARKGWMTRAYTGSYMYRGELVSVDRGPETQSDYWTVARDAVFDEAPAWKAAVANELAELRGESRVPQQVVPVVEVPEGSSLYRAYPHQFSLALQEGWTAHDQSLMSGGELGPFNLIIFSPVDMAALMAPTKDAEAIERMKEVMLDLDTGKIECFMLNRHAAGKGMTCEGFSDKAVRKVLKMASEHSFLQKGADVVQEPRAERLAVGGCQGLRVFASGRTPNGSEWAVDTRAVADGEILYLFFVRTLTDYFESNRRAFELALLDLRMAAAG